jgi:ribosomal protein S18 acetylase RimI-like enzyme
MDIQIVDVSDEATFGRIPPCAEPAFDHRTCDYWEDDRRGSKSARPAWLQPAPRAPDPAPRPPNPFAPPADRSTFNPFDPGGAGGSSRNAFDPFGSAPASAAADNPFAPLPSRRQAFEPDAPRKLQLLGRGKAVFGSYAKVLERDGVAAAYCQFGPLSAYPRAQSLRDLYRQLPASPLPAVITCIATTEAARHEGLAKRLVEAVVLDLAGRGFSAVEAYPELGVRPNATSAALPAFWLACGFAVAVADERFPVMRREL